MAEKERSFQKNKAESRGDFRYKNRNKEGHGTVGEPAENVVAGRNAVSELLKSGRAVDKLYVQKGEREGSLPLLVALANERRIPVVEVQKQKLDQMAGEVRHQGVVALAAQKEYAELEDILAIAKERGEDPFIVLCDGIDDPGNLGALIRCADGAGAHGVVITKRRSVGLTAVVNKASAGALEHMAVAKVSNLAATIDELKKEGFWIYGAEAGGKPCYETDLKGPIAVVMGSEGQGLSHLVTEKCDFIISIDMYGKVNSFNVSCAAAVILCEAARQRHGKN